jgi:hypothetical protein
MRLPLLREPLLPFLVLGAALFGLYSLADTKKAEAPANIVVSSARIANLADGLARTWPRKPSKAELEGLVDDYIRDEVFYREGRAAGLDRDDVIIRRRVRQKMEFLAEDMSALEPTEEQLVSYLKSNPERFRTEDQFTFRQIFLSATKRLSTIARDSTELANVLARGDSGVAATALGDPFLLGEEFRALSRTSIAGIFGESFANQISGVEPGRWQGPVSSSFGQHFVLLGERISGSVPSLENVRQAVRREWTNARRLEAELKLYTSLRDHYEILVETSPANSTVAEIPP